MLGFSDENKQRIGGARQGTGKGVVCSVLGRPGRLVGGILGGGLAEANANMASENHASFPSSKIAATSAQSQPETVIFGSQPKLNLVHYNELEREEEIYSTLCCWQLSKHELNDQGLVEIYVCKDQPVQVKLLKPSVSLDPGQA
ncbi:golgin Putative 4 [Actinidia rufa]|uniref:Golgin Putative 4 n=1 Tax=Actinidia rufa TaxID=165716 RepID=A0A7J0ECS1_9ERIC|nr:golgin Putative 4 [Actinidia rufa]